ncbi:MAG TPA: replication-relaxation family protein [Anaeromyxobacter sp.]|nr:replication-relaxation family protein [Anaeromyxobacter sp.]
MPHPKGAILTERDRALLSFVGIARYASAEQLHGLFFEGRSKKQVYRRLAKLCQPGSRPGEGACLRRLEYRRREGTGVPVWALTGYGRSLVVPLVPWLRPPAAHDIGARFLEHTLILNDVLAGLVLRLRVDVAAPLAALPSAGSARTTASCATRSSSEARSACTRRS